MVGILQKVLQLYAAHVLRFDEIAIAKQFNANAPSGADAVPEKVHPDFQSAADLYIALIEAARDMNTDADEWNPILKRALLPREDALGAPALVNKRQFMTL